MDGCMDGWMSGHMGDTPASLSIDKNADTLLV